MTSPTDKTEKCRANKMAAKGKTRKALLLKTGSTPKLFKLNKPTPNELKANK